MSRRFALSRVADHGGPPLPNELLLDFSALHDQKTALLDLIAQFTAADGWRENVHQLQGLLHLCDGLQDLGLRLGVPESEVSPIYGAPD